MGINVFYKYFHHLAPLLESQKSFQNFYILKHSSKNKGDFLTVKSNLGRIHITHLLKDAMIKLGYT